MPTGLRFVLVLTALLLAACGGTPGPRPLSATLVEATVEQSCAGDAGPPCSSVVFFVNAPHCGHDVTPLDPAAAATTVDSSEPAASLVGVWEVRTAAVNGAGVRTALEPRRAVLSSSRTEAPVYPVVSGGGPLYRLTATGRLTPLPDAGDVETDDAGASVFRYQVELGDGGLVDVTERHRVSASWQVDATVRDHSGDPFYGCCAHVGTATPVAVLALLLLLRRRSAARG